MIVGTDPTCPRWRSIGVLELGADDAVRFQNAAMAHLEKQILNEMERFSPEALLKSWFNLSPINQEPMQQFFTNVFKNVSPRG